MCAMMLTIDDQTVPTLEGQTILDVCRDRGIYVPTLCHLEGLSSVGGCRLCIVEIDGQRRPVPACTTPATDKMVVRTNTPSLEKLRRQTIELLFSERNHICPFCPASGNCELQNAGYRSGMDHVRYDYCFPRLAVDNTHARITLDHNRCVLCTRCVRACDEWVGAHVLDIDHRGTHAMLIADNGISLGESSCISCGTCVSVCPTGALFEKRSIHWQGRLPMEKLQTVCPSCGVGCHIRASVRHRQIGSVEAAGGPDGNRVLCEKGRFGLVEPQTPRIQKILLKRANRNVEIALSEATHECVRRLSAPMVMSDPERVIALISPRLPLETITAAHSFLHRVVGSTRWGVLDRTNAAAVRDGLHPNGTPPQTTGKASGISGFNTTGGYGPVPLAGLRDLEESDMFLLVGCNLDASHGVVASYVRRAVLHRRARLAKINPRHTWMTDWTDVYIEVPRKKDALVLAAIAKYLIDAGRITAPIPEALLKSLRGLEDADITSLTGVPAEKLRAVADLYGQAKRPMIICGTGLTRYGPEGLAAAMNLVQATQQRTPSGRLRLMEVAIGANTAGTRLLGKPTLDLNMLDPHSADVAFVFLADEERVWPIEALENLRAVGFVVALAARQHPVVEAAHLVIPVPAWAERKGTFVNLEGRVQKAQNLMDPEDCCVDEISWMRTLATAWRGPDCAWDPVSVPESIQDVSDGHWVPCDVQERVFNPSILEVLTGA